MGIRLDTADDYSAEAGDMDGRGNELGAWMSRDDTHDRVGCRKVHWRDPEKRMRRNLLGGLREEQELGSTREVEFLNRDDMEEATSGRLGSESREFDTGDVILFSWEDGWNMWEGN